MIKCIKTPGSLAMTLLVVMGMKTLLTSLLAGFLLFVQEVMFNFIL